MIRRIFCALIVISQSFILAAPATRPATQPAFIGEWDTTFGLMRVTLKGQSLEGTYGVEENSIKGTLAGRKFTFTYTEPSAAGEGWFEIAEDGQTFSGKWRENGAARWDSWTGKRRADTFAKDTFAGLWKTSYGRMRLRQIGDEVRGAYNFGGNATIIGKLEGRTLKFKYEQPDGEKGDGRFELSEDGKNFAGTWNSAAGANQAEGKWSGTRVVPQAGKMWLVVLEANWEADLTQEEYSFGLMLRTFFARVPNVAVRHRFFASEADFRRWMAELPYIAEPVILHISSHGTREGITCGDGKTIDGKTISECLKDVGDNLKLLHFGTCLIAGGDIPRQIQTSLGPAATFPISGYANSADWGGSAVIDFTYLDLIFSHGLSPAEAARQTRAMLSFAGNKGNPADAISPADLVIIEPKAKVAGNIN